MGTAEYDRSAPVHDALTLPWDRQGEAHGPSWMPHPTFGHAGTAVSGGDSAAFAVARYRTGGTLDPDGALRLVE